MTTAAKEDAQVTTTTDSEGRTDYEATRYKLLSVTPTRGYKAVFVVRHGDGTYSLFGMTLDAIGVAVKTRERCRRWPAGTHEVTGRWRKRTVVGLTHDPVDGWVIAETACNIVGTCRVGDDVRCVVERLDDHTRSRLRPEFRIHEDSAPVPDQPVSPPAVNDTVTTG